MFVYRLLLSSCFLLKTIHKSETRLSSLSDLYFIGPLSFLSHLASLLLLLLLPKAEERIQGEVSIFFLALSSAS